MKTKKIPVIISGILMLPASIAAIVTDILVFISRLSAVSSSLLLTLVSCGLVILWAILNLYTGLSAIAGRKKSKKLKKCFILGVISVIIFIIQGMISAMNGIAVNYLLILAVCGFAIPCIHIFTCRSRM